MDRGAWWAMVQRVAKSQTWMKWHSVHTRLKLIVSALLVASNTWSFFCFLKTTGYKQHWRNNFINRIPLLSLRLLLTFLTKRELNLSLFGEYFWEPCSRTPLECPRWWNSSLPSMLPAAHAGARLLLLWTSVLLFPLSLSLSLIRLQILQKSWPMYSYLGKRYSGPLNNMDLNCLVHLYTHFTPNRYSTYIFALQIFKLTKCGGTFVFN